MSTLKRCCNCFRLGKVAQAKTVVLYGKEATQHICFRCHDRGVSLINPDYDISIIRKVVA